jgi:hypothetical protein
MNAGYAQAIITPRLDKPVYLAGFGQNRQAESVHDDLFVRAIALSDGDTRLVLCSLDLIGFFQNYVAEVARRVKLEYPNVHILIASTHTHHGPDTMGIYGPDDKTTGVDLAYIANLQDKVVATILECLEMKYQVSAMKSGSVHVPGIAKNARDPEIVDDELAVFQLLNADHNPIVTFVNFPCHPEVLFDKNTRITSDYPGVLRRTVEAETLAPCVFTSGALGGMMTPDVTDHTFEEAQEMGVKLARAGLDLLQKTRSISKIGIYFNRHTISARLTNILFKIAIRRGLLPEPRDHRGYVITEANLIRIGGCWLVSVPGELLPKLGLEIKKRLKDAGAQVAGVIGLGNDELGYILPKEDFRYPLNPFRPGSHYEETMSISKEIGPQVMEAVDDLLKSKGPKTGL